MVFVELNPVLISFTGLTASSVDCFFVDGLPLVPCIGDLEDEGLIPSLETGALPIGSTLLMNFLWLSGFSCCLLDIGGLFRKL